MQKQHQDDLSALAFSSYRFSLSLSLPPSLSPGWWVVGGGSKNRSVRSSHMHVVEVKGLALRGKSNKVGKLIVNRSMLCGSFCLLLRHSAGVLRHSAGVLRHSAGVLGHSAGVPGPSGDDGGGTSDLKCKCLHSY